MNVLFYIANIPSAPYMYKLIKVLMKSIAFRILIALSFRD